MSGRARELERRILGAFATVARQWGAVPLEGTIAEQVGLDIEDSEIRMIYVLGARTEELSPGDVAQQLGVTRPTLSKSLTRLRLAGLVESAPTESDRRSVYITLTDEGKAAYVTLVEFGMDLVRSASAGMTHAECDAVGAFLERFANGLGGPPAIVFPRIAR